MNPVIPAMENVPLHYDVESVRSDFPILAKQVNGHPLVFLDTGASAQKPGSVLECMDEMYRTSYSNVHRGAYALSQDATDRYEGARATVARYLNARSNDEVIFTHNVTGAINLISNSYGRSSMGPGDEVIISHMEHHANIVPWQLLSDKIGIVVKVAPIDNSGDLLLDKFESLLSSKTKLVSITHISNVLGTILPIKEIIELAHDWQVPVLVDGAQGIVHDRVDVQALDVDFYAFTGHKLYGPSGIGVLYGRKELLNDMPPFEGGGDMVEQVTFEKTTYRDTPARFEAGTPPIVEAVGLAAAIDFIDHIGIENIAVHEQELLNYASPRLREISGLKIIGEPRRKAGIISFTLEDVHPHDISTIIDSRGIAIRAGHHCAQPLMDRFDVAATARVSFGMYNSKGDVDALIEALAYVKDIFG